MAESRSRIIRFFSGFGSKDRGVQDESLKIDLKSDPELVGRFQKRHLTDEERYSVVSKFYLEKGNYEIKENVVWGESPYLYDKITKKAARDKSGKPIKFHLSWTPKLTDKGMISPQKEPSMLKFLQEKYNEEKLLKIEKVVPPSSQPVSGTSRPEDLPKTYNGLTQEANDALRKIDEEGMPGLMPSYWLRMFKENGISPEAIYKEKLPELIKMLRAKVSVKPVDVIATVVGDKGRLGEELKPREAVFEPKVPTSTPENKIVAKEECGNKYQASVQAFIPYLKMLERDGAYNSASKASSEAYKAYKKAFEESGEVREDIFKSTGEGRGLLEKFKESLEIKRKAAETFRSSMPRAQELYDIWREIKLRKVAPDKVLASK
jgi:hypothetical protein